MNKYYYLTIVSGNDEQNANIVTHQVSNSELLEKLVAILIKYPVTKDCMMILTMSVEDNDKTYISKTSIEILDFKLHSISVA